MDYLEKKWRRKSSFQICISSYQAYISLHLQAFLQMCNLPVKVVCRANAEYMSPSGKCVFSVDTVYSFVLRIESKALNLLGQYFTTGRISRISSPRCQILGFVFSPPLKTYLLIVFKSSSYKLNHEGLCLFISPLVWGF